MLACLFAMLMVVAAWWAVACWQVFSLSSNPLSVKLEQDSEGVIA
jgi:hypothetical protein